MIIYLKLLCMSLQNNGIIYFEGNYGTVEDEIALSLREDIYETRTYGSRGGAR